MGKFRFGSRRRLLRNAGAVVLLVPLLGLAPAPGSDVLSSTDTANEVVSETAPGAVEPAMPEDPADVVRVTEVAVLDSPAPVVAEPEVPVGVFDRVGDPASVPERVEELVGERTAQSDTWLNADGSLSVTSYVLPRYFQDPATDSWVPIDATVKPERSAADGEVRLVSGENTWTVSFGDSNSKAGMQSFALEGKSITFRPVGASDVSPTSEESLVRYDGLWPATDAVYSVSSVGVDERIVLHSAEAPSRFDFVAEGARPRLNDEGGVDLLVDGMVIATIPPLTVDTASGPVVPARAGASFVLSEDTATGAPVVGVEISRDWLMRLPKDEFPVVIDPTITPQQAATSMTRYHVSGAASPGLRVGWSSGAELWRSKVYVPTPSLPGGGAGPWKLTVATMDVDIASPGGSGLELTLIGHTTEPMSFGAILTGSNVTGPTASLIGDFNELPTFATIKPTSWVAQHPDPGHWYGLIATNNGGSQGDLVRDLSNLRITYWYSQAPNRSSLHAPTGTIPTTTPTLQATTVDDNEVVWYRYQVGTDPGAVGNVVDSGWLRETTTTEQAPAWQVPPGSLTDGATYYVKVWSGYHPSIQPPDIRYVAPAEPTTIVPITIKKRLGAGGPSPTDTVGAVPGSTQTPSEAAPSPGVAPASVTVNMVTGNLAVTLNTHPLPTLSGPAGVSLSYDSLGSTGVDGGGRGLSGTYFTASTMIGQRIDPTIDFTWSGSPMGGYLAPTAAVTAEWTGTITAPETPSAGAWHLGGRVSSGTMEIYLDGATTPDVTITATTAPTFGAALAWAPNTSRSIKIKYTSNGARGLQLWASDDGADPEVTATRFVVPSGWLTPNSVGLPAGWRLSANPYNGAWTRLVDLGGQVVLHSASGATATFNRRPDGSYAPPTGSTELLAVAKTTIAGAVTAGEFTLSNNVGLEVVFGRDGWVRSVRTLADDRRPTALQYTYEAVAGTGSTPVLTQITDPVTARSIDLCYGAATCDVAGYAASNAPAGMLSRIDYWDGTVGAPSYTTLVYDGSGRLVRLRNPGDLVADFTYAQVNVDGDVRDRMTGIRDPLAYDAIAAGQRPVDCPAAAAFTPECMTQITYDGSGRVATVTQPAPTVGTARTRRTYTYNPGGAKAAQVSISGFSPASGYASRVEWDENGRIVRQYDPEGRVTHTVWDTTVDRVLTSIDSVGLQVTNVYDPVTNLVTDVYGPALSSCFSASPPYTPAGACTVAVPHTQHRYDENINNLAAAFWDNPYFAGTAVKNSTGPLGTGPSGPGCPADTLCTQWNTLPVTPSGATRGTYYDPTHQFTWSMRLTGIIDVPVAFRIRTTTTQQATVYLNDALYSEVNPHTSSNETEGQFGEWWTGPADPPALMPAGRYRIQVDLLGANTTTLNGLMLAWDPGPGYLPWMSTTVLSPDYGLETTTIDPDNLTIATSYTDTTNGIGPELGLVTAVTQDPADLALTTSTTYEPPAAGRWFRKTASTLPAGTTTTYKHYCATPTSSDCGSDQFADALATDCGVNTADSQHGLPAEQTDPAPNPTTSGRTQQFLYDHNGRIVGRRVAPAASIATAPWQCTTYDTRGRITTQEFPAFGPAAARTVTYTYAVAGNPLRTSVSDPNGTITSYVDLLGRLTAYVDTNNRTTLYNYDNAGRLKAVIAPNSTTTHTYYPNSSKPETVTITSGANILASAALTYQADGRLWNVSYNGGQMAAYYAYDAYGNQNSLIFEQDTLPVPTRITGHTVTRSPAGRQINAFVDTGATSLVDPNPGTGNDNYIYDDAGRLTFAHLVGGLAEYSYAANPPGDNCTTHATGINPQPGRNTNRTSTTWTPLPTGTATTTRSCYNTADQLVATINGTTATTTYAYDSHGNQTLDGTNTYTWDSADRFTGITAPGTTVTYARDALDRPITRTHNGTITRYAYNGYGDTAAGTLTAAGTVLQEFHYLPGGVLVTVDQATLTNTWSYPDLNGSYTTTTNNSGMPLGSRIHHDPWGAPLPGTGAINNATGSADLTNHGMNGKLTDTASGVPITLMGARPYSAQAGRFLSVDPVVGGCANGYVYGFGDPLNGADLSGKGWGPFDDIWDGAKDVGGAVGGAIGDAASWAGRTIWNNRCQLLSGVSIVAAFSAVVVSGGTLAWVLVGVSAVTAVAAPLSVGNTDAARAAVVEQIFAAGFAGVGSLAVRAAAGADVATGVVVPRLMGGFTAVVSGVQMTGEMRGTCG